MDNMYKASKMQCTRLIEALVAIAETTARLFVLKVQNSTNAGQTKTFNSACPRLLLRKLASEEFRKLISSLQRAICTKRGPA